MIEITNVAVFGFDAAIRGMRNPMDSWALSDSFLCNGEQTPDCDGCSACTTMVCSGEISCALTDSIGFDKYEDWHFALGEGDMELCKKLIKAGTDHRKFLRMVHVQMDVKAPVFFLSELDTYKIGTVRNSCSFMHKGLSKPFDIKDFSVSEKVYEILSDKSPKDFGEIEYPYETDEYKTHVCENGREYEVYRNGRVFAKAFSYVDNYGSGRTRQFERKEAKPSLTKGGYWELNLGGKNGEKWLLHRLVAFHWCENPNDFETVDHLNGNKNDNSMENLEWVSRKENIKRGFSNGLMRTGNIKADYFNWKCSSKLLPNERCAIREKYKNGKTQIELAKEYNLSQAQISVICRNSDSSSNNKDLFELCWFWEQIIKNLNELRELYLETKDNVYFKQIRELLPMGYLYKSTLDLNYEVLMNMYHARKNHKLDEWRDFCKWIEKLPYMKDFLEAA